MKRAALGIGLALYTLVILYGVWLLADLATRPTVIQVPVEVEAGPEPAYTCDLSPPERPDLAARLDSLRCAVHSIAERHGNPRMVRGIVATRSIPASFPWKGWPADWNLCDVFGAGWGCNRQVAP